MTPRLTLYNREGQRFSVETVVVGPRSYTEIDLRDLAQEAGPGFEDGSLRVSYTGRAMELGGLLRMTNPATGVEFHEQLMYPSTAHSNQLEGIWMVPNSTADGRIVVTNTTSSAVDVQVRLDGLLRVRTESLHLGPWQLYVLDIREAGDPRGAAREARFGGVSITYTGNPGSVIARGMVVDARVGYSSNVAFVDPITAKSSTYQAGGVHVAPVGRSALRPALAARNIGSTTTTLSGRLVVAGDGGESTSIELPATAIAAGATVALDGDAAWRRAARLATGPTAGIEFEYNTAPGTVIVSAASVSRDLQHVLQIPLTDPLTLPSGTGGYFWRTDATRTSIVSIKNVTDQPSRFHLLIRHAEGVWAPKLRTVQPHETVVIDIGELQRLQTQDARGRTISTTMSGGQVHWSVVGGGAPKSLMGRMEQVDLARGVSSTYACPMPTNDIYESAWIEPGYDEVAEGVDVGFWAMEQDRDAFNQQLEEPYDITDTLSWSSYNTNVAVPDSAPGWFWGVGAGNTSVRAQGSSNGWEEYHYEENPENHVPLDLSAELQVRAAVSSVSQTNTLHLSVGDTDKELSVTVSPSNVSILRSLSKNQVSNPHGDCWVTLTIPSQTGMGTTQHAVTASGSTCMGMFDSRATAGGVQSSSPTRIKVPPQKLIKMLWGEAENYSETLHFALGSTARNRFGHQDFNNVQTWNNALNSDFQGITREGSPDTGPQPYLDRAVAIYEESFGDTVGGSTCFWTPNSTQWANVQAAKNSGTTTFPFGTGAPCFALTPSTKQIVIKLSVENRHGGSAPAFLFVRERTSSDPAVVEIQ